MRGIAPWQMMKQCSDLKELCKLLTEMDREDIDYDEWDCPSFGGREPWGQCISWSYDEKLIREDSGRLKVVKRVYPGLTSEDSEDDEG